MMFKDVLLALEGCNQFADYQQHLLRRSTFIVASAFNGKWVSANMKKLWPVDTDETPVNVSERNKKILEKFKEIDVKQKVKDLNNAGRS